MLEEGEIVTHLDVPPPVDGLHSSYRKIRGRGSWDFALAGVALALSFSGSRVSSARVVLSGAAPVPWRSQEVEEVIVGTSLEDGVIERAAEAAVADARPLQHNAYKIPLFKGMIEEELSKIRTG
jgi:xanthine dehydrogenase YagS FAD-binding subunit